MKCKICKSEDVPVNNDGEYLSKFQIPFHKTTFASDSLEGLKRVIIHFPMDYPLCKKCRKEIVTNGFDHYQGPRDVDMSKV